MQIARPEYQMGELVATYLFPPFAGLDVNDVALEKTVVTNSRETPNLEHQEVTNNGKTTDFDAAKKANAPEFCAFGSPGNQV
jgi:hypothetical protein